MSYTLLLLETDGESADIGKKGAYSMNIKAILWTEGKTDRQHLGHAFNDAARGRAFPLTQKPSSIQALLD